jgi:putative colanic acid biosynthesis UDP-glucose lipid carrier transferase
MIQNNISNYVLPGLTRLVDFCVVLLSGYFAIKLRFNGEEPPNNFYYLLICLAAFLFATLGNKLYSSWRGRSIYRLLFLILTYWFICQAILLGIIFYTQSGIFFSRFWLAYWTFIALFSLFLVRILTYFVLKKVRFKGVNQKKLVIIGGGQLTDNLIRQIEKNHETGFCLISILQHDELEKIRKLNDVSIDEIWVAFTLIDGDKVNKVLEALLQSPATIRIAPDLFTYRLINHNVSEILGFPMFDITSTPLVGINAFFKDTQDFIISLIALIVISPLMLLLAIGVKLSSNGPIFYKQERVSLNGKIFQMLKFRSMAQDVEKDEVVWGRSDSKVKGRFGKFLRDTNLDELPQLINVLKGEMSIVGPRPERPMFVNEFKNIIPYYMKKHLVKGGITGWAQVNGLRGDTDLNSRIEYDLFYIENWSMWLDIKIIFLTIGKLFKNNLNQQI